MASMYGVYHGPNGLRRIALQVHKRACTLAAALQKLGFKLTDTAFFDTLEVEGDQESRAAILERATFARIN